MKTTVMMITLILAVAAGGFADTQKRAQWWNLRAEAISREKSEMEHRGASPALIELLGREAARARELAGRAETPAAAPSGAPTIHEASQQAASDAFAAWSLRFLTSADRKCTATDPMRVLAETLRPIYAQKGIDEDARYAEDAVKKALSAAERDYFIFEYQLSGLSAAQDGIVRRAAAAVEQSAAERIAASVSLSADPSAAAAKAADDYFRAFDFRTAFACGAETLSSSWCWMKAERFVRLDAARLSAASEFTALTAAGHDAAAIDALSRNRNDFEKVTFSKLTAKLMDTSPFTSDGGVRIPKEPDMAALFVEIDEARRAAIADRSSADIVLKKADEQMLASISKYMKPCADAFFRQEEKMKILSGDDDRDLQPDHSPLSAAREQFREKVRKANLYRSSSLHLVSFFTAQRDDSADALALYTKRLESGRRCLGIIAALDSRAAGAADGSDGAKIYEGLRARERAAVDYVQGISALDAQERRPMDKGQIADALKLKESFSKDCTSALAQIASNRTRRSINPKIDESGAGEVDVNIAQAEIASLARSAGDWAELVRSLDRSAAAFESYALLYGRLTAEIREGRVTDELLRAVREDSLLPQLSNFSAETVTRESSERTYAKKALKRTVAQLKSLAEYYSRRNIACSAPSAGTIAEYERECARNSSVKIGDWVMTDANFAEVDRKAVRVLSNLRKRSAWSTGQSAQRAADTTTEIPQAGISISIPDGYEERTVDGSDTNSVVRRFASTDNLSIISVAVIPLGGKNEREAAEEWLGRLGKTTVKSSAGRNGMGSFYWNVSKDEHRNVTESIAVARGENLLIITGETSKERYPFFKERLSAVFSSAK